MPEINWPTLSATSIHVISFYSIVYDSNIYQLISEPTHIKGNILNLLLTNDPDGASSLSLDLSYFPVCDLYTVSQTYILTVFPSSRLSVSFLCFLQLLLSDWQGLNDYLCPLTLTLVSPHLTWILYLGFHSSSIHQSM